MNKLIFLLGLSIALFSCSSSDSEIKVIDGIVKDTIVDSFEERVALMDELSAVLFEDSMNFNPESAQNLLAAYEDYVKFHSFQSDSKEIQFKAGELAKALNKPHVAIKHFNGLLERDPDHDKAPVALFYKAMIIGDMLHEDDLAKATYQEFIDNYPDHPFVESAKASIELQGQSLDDIVAGFEKKNNS